MHPVVWEGVVGIAAAGDSSACSVIWAGIEARTNSFSWSSFSLDSYLAKVASISPSSFEDGLTSHRRASSNSFLTEGLGATGGFSFSTSSSCTKLGKYVLAGFTGYRL